MVLGTCPIEGVAVDDFGSFDHVPVMLREVVELFSHVPLGRIVDATLGGGGHAEALAKTGDGRQIIGIDQDPTALAAATKRFAMNERLSGRLTTIRARFDVGLAELAGEKDIVGVLFDLGVSSPQFDRAERGFSYRSDAPLDMRMDPDASLDAANFLASATVDEIADALKRYADERFAHRIARAIVANRPILTTGHLARVVADAIPAPARRHGGHPAKRTFQALRIAVNHELEILRPALEQAIDLVGPGGRVVVLSYHSGEDKIVKSTFAEAVSGGCTCPVGLPCVCGAQPTARKIGRRLPSPEEISQNPRSSSARLRAVEVV